MKNLIILLPLKLFNIEIDFLTFSAWCPLKGHTYLSKPAAFSCLAKGHVTLQARDNQDKLSYCQV